jgi:hypothetical protein
MPAPTLSRAVTLDQGPCRQSERKREGNTHPPTHPPNAYMHTTHTTHTWRVLFEGKGGGRGHGTCQQLHVHRLIRLLANLFPPFFGEGKKAGEISNETVHERHQKKNVRGTTHRLVPIFYIFLFILSLDAPQVTSRTRDLFSPPVFLSLCLSLFAPSHSHHMEEKTPRNHRDVAKEEKKGKRKEKIPRNHRTNATKRISKEKEKEKKRKVNKTQSKKCHETTGATQRYIPPPRPHPHHTQHPQPLNTPSNCSFVPQDQSRPAG